jgi:hypothetical protein
MTIEDFTPFLFLSRTEKYLATPTKNRAQMPILKLVKENGNLTLKILTLEDTLLLERIKAWFGFGPLSLGNIANHISATNSQNKELTNFIYRKACHYNKTHFFNKISKTTLKTLSKDRIEFGAVTSDNLNFSYALSRTGYVYDGIFHNNPEPDLSDTKVVDKFNMFLGQKMLEVRFKTLQGVDAWFASLKKLLFSEIVLKKKDKHSYDATPVENYLKERHTSLSFARVIEINGKQKLFTAQAGNSIIIIRSSTGKYKLINKQDAAGFGVSMEHTSLHQIEPGDEIFGMTDGIAEFLTIEEIQKEIDKNVYRNELVKNLKRKIESFDETDPTQITGRKKLPCANAVKEKDTLKIHDPNSPNGHNDIALFYFTV